MSFELRMRASIPVRRREDALPRIGLMLEGVLGRGFSEVARRSTADNDRPTHFLKETARKTTRNRDQALEKYAAFENTLREIEKCVSALAFFRSDAPIRPRSKIPRSALPALCLAFCWPVRVDEAAQLTGFSVPTVRTVYLSLRELLLDPRYREWYPYAWQPPLLFDHGESEQLRQLVLSRYADCYANQECQRNFRYGRRKGRECTSCPTLLDPLLAEHIDEEGHSSWLDLIDLTRIFYLRDLGIRHESGFRAAILKRRAYHVMIFLMTRIERKPRRKVIDVSMPPSGVLDLCETLLRHMAECDGLESFPIPSRKA